MLFLLDVHRNILSAQSLFKCNDDCITNLEIVLEPNNLCIKIFRNSSVSQFNIVLPEKFLHPNTVSSVFCGNWSNVITHDKNITTLKFSAAQSDLKSSAPKIPSTLEISFRFRISNISVLESCILNHTSSHVDFKDVLYRKYKNVKTFKVICTNCGTFLTEKDIKFLSVHNYYEGKSELDETSFCHKHGDHDSSEINTELLYIGDMFFYFHHSLLKLFGLLKSGKIYKCIKCLSILSFQKKMDNLQYIGFFSDKIMLIEPQIEVHDVEQYRVNTSLSAFSSVIQEILLTSLSSKVYFLSKVNIIVSLKSLAKSFLCIL